MQVTHRDYITYEFALLTPTDEILTVTLHPGLSLTGYVVDQNNERIREFSLRLSPASRQHDAPASPFDSKAADISPSDGYFRINGLAPQTYILSLDPPNSESLETRLELLESTSVTIVLNPADSDSPIGFASPGRHRGLWDGNRRSHDMSSNASRPWIPCPWPSAVATLPASGRDPTRMDLASVMNSLSASLGAGSALFVCLTVALASPTDPASLEFFEKEIRPLLAGRCYECHSAQTATPFAGLRLTARRPDQGGRLGTGRRSGQAGGEPLDPPHPGRPALMPPTGALSDAQIRSLIEWVKMGAPWTDLAEASQASAGGFDLEARKRSHWAWQPVRSVPPPAVADANWPLHPMDRFILAKLEQEGLEPAPAADRYTLIRRLSYDLRGLPPLPGEVQAFVSDSSPRAYENLVDDFMDSAHFGEQWARHWMDLVRYSESHGSQGDPKAPYAWRYRDYLIRALNADIPYDQLIREHLAGDLLPSSRMNPALGINESLLATAHFRMVEHGFQPVDPLGDRIKWTDNQVDVVSKAFQDSPSRARAATTTSSTPSAKRTTTPCTECSTEPGRPSGPSTIRSASIGAEATLGVEGGDPPAAG